MLYCLCRLLCSCDYAEWLFELRRAPIRQTRRLRGAKGIVKLWKAPGRFRRRCFFQFFYFLTCMQKRRCDGGAWKLAGYNWLCWVHYAKIEKNPPFSFKMELKMCWFCLHWTHFLNFLGLDHSVCAKPQNNTDLGIAEPCQYGAAAQVTIERVTNVSQKWCIFPLLV